MTLTLQERAFMRSGNIALTEKYRPRTIGDLCAQRQAVNLLTSFTQNPYAVAFLFDGDTGTGKTSAAIALANDLGVDVNQAEFGGLYQIPSGEQTGDTVRRLVNSLHTRPFSGSGWKVLIVNEADHMTPNAAMVWLDALERLPRETVVIFTTNEAEKLPRRFRTRCECLHFESSALLLAADAQAFINRIWQAETGNDNAPSLFDLPYVIDGDSISFRQILQSLSVMIRSGVSPKPVHRQSKSQPDLEDIDILRGLATRWKSGEKLADLAKPLGLSWQQLIGAFWSNNIVPRGSKGTRITKRSKEQ